MKKILASLWLIILFSPFIVVPGIMFGVKAFLSVVGVGIAVFIIVLLTALALDVLNDRI